jgi:putative alpha-1,2-mannosidase
VLPATGDIGAEPWSATQRYTHDDEIGEPGYYAVSFPDSGIRSELTATDRVGISRIAYPEGAAAQFMVRPGGSLAGNAAADLRVIDSRTVVGSATTGNFCGKGNSYTIYFQLSFDQDFLSHGTWDGNEVQEGADTVSSSRAGAYFTFPEGIHRWRESQHGGRGTGVGLRRCEGCRDAAME